MRIYTAEGTIPAEVFARMPVCQEHIPTEEEIRTFMTANWEGFCMGFDRAGKTRPVLDLTEYTWVPWQEYVDFCKEYEKIPDKIQMYRN